MAISLRGKSEKKKFPKNEGGEKWTTGTGGDLLSNSRQKKRANCSPELAAP